MVPKFRVWSKTLGSKTLGEYLQLDETSNDQGLGMLFEVKKGIGSNVTSICHSIGDVVEQFTGLKDVNGKDIYEGDIVEVTIEGCIQGDKYLVKNMWDPHVWTEESDSYYAVQKMEVKGNVHTNPELLEDK